MFTIILKATTLYTRFSSYGFWIYGFSGYMVYDFWTRMSFYTLKYYGNKGISAIWSNFGGQNRSPYIQNRIYYLNKVSKQHLHCYPLFH